ncbi:BN6_48550 family protein [Verrucosispora sp. WMMA2044]|uniref:CATRA conflict system CASPASE/TPR repeat-associated protein n=1 Tax=Verrucosispora sp. WMMA2044 TaxID=3016419 RepID=UPI00248AE55A|nr:CATRA conflict system CASPASE/TPR repeat-associated protein [Verrucosispora sp. WMMA2044]WBB50159.1 BN6_48550 family protein [Verrucosispora sp. WMMA2044]
MRRQALHVYNYLDTGPHRDVLASLVAACRTLGIANLSEVAEARPSRQSARRLFSSPTPGLIFEALEYVTARVAAFLVCLAADDDSGTWREFDRDWRNALGRPQDSGYSGRVRLFYGLYDGDGDPDRLAGIVAAALPDGLGSLQAAPTVLFEGCYLWEVGGAAEPHRLERVMVLLAPADRECDSDRLVWPHGHSVLRPLPAYLWEMANVRHQARRLAERRMVYQPEALLERAGRFERAEVKHPRGAAVREAMLSTLRREVALVAAHEAVLRTMHRTVEAATANARVWLEAGWVKPVSPDVGGDVVAPHVSDPVGQDLRYAKWLLVEILDEADTVRDAVSYAEPMARIGTAEIEQRLREQGERAEFRSVLQTSVIAAIGLLLAAAQTFDYSIPMYASLKMPSVVTIACVALLIPLAVALRSRPESRWRWLWAGLAGISVASALVWLATTALIRWRTGHPATVQLSRTAVAITAAAVSVGFIAMRRATRSRHTSW